MSALETLLSRGEVACRVIFGSTSDVSVCVNLSAAAAYFSGEFVAAAIRFLASQPEQFQRLNLAYGTLRGMYPSGSSNGERVL
ncbi:hypothetical protein CWI88_06480 [Enterobacter cancerogenus]|nr:hypothetical protein CWI88_06480 [Enterobacter cancerogenus]